MERASRTLPSFVHRRRICPWDPGHSKALVWRNHEDSKEVHTCEAVVGFRSGTRAASSSFSMQRTLLKRHPDRQRNGQKAMLGTRIMYVLCLWWKSLFAAMVREMVPDGGDENYLQTGHGFLRGQMERGSNARTTMHALCWTIPSEFAHRCEQWRRQASKCSRETSG